MEESTKTMSKGFKIFLIILIIGTLFFMKVENRDKLSNIIQDITVKEKSLDFISRIEMENGAESISLYDSTLIKWNNNNLSFLKSDGSVLWEKEYNFVDPLIHYGENWIYTIDKSTGHIYCMDNNGDTIYKAQLNESVFGVQESENNLIVHIKTSEGENIKILDETGNIILVHEEVDNNILYYDINKDKTNYSVSVLNMTGDAIRSQLGIYTIGGEKLEDVDFENGIIIKTKFIGKDLLVLTDASLNYIKDGEVKWKRHFPGIKDFNLDGDKIQMLYDKNFETIGLDGKTIDKLVFAAEYTKIIPSDKFTILYGKHNIVGINGDKEIFDYKMDKEILSLYYNQSTVYIHNAEEIEMFKLKTK